MLCVKILKNIGSLNRAIIKVEKYFPVLSSYYKFDFIKLERNAHTDIPTPDFEEYRRSSIADPHKPSSHSADDRKAFTCLITFTTVLESHSSSYLFISSKQLDATTTTSIVGSLGGMYVGKSHLLHYVLFLNPSRDLVASAQSEVQLSDVSEGKTLIVKWQEKPIFITHRTQDVIDRERATPLSNLRDPETDDKRAVRPEWLIIIGICTHLGCIPIPNAGDFPGGYFCPCHGSHFDGSGRARKGPAVINLEVPRYEFIQDDVILIG